MNTDRIIEHDARSTKHEEPLVSVCIGVYNRERYIRECLDSVLAQTYSNREIVVIDDASTDGSLEILKSYGAKIRLLTRSHNSGICPVTRNEAVRAARGEFIAFLDSDDAWCSDRKLEKQVDFLLRNPSIPLCHTYAEIMDEKSIPGGVRHEGVLPSTGPYFEALLHHCWITISSVMIRRAVYDEVGPFNERPPYGYLGEDHEFFLRVAKRYDIGLVPEVLIAYRKSSEGITAGNWRAKPEPVELYRAILRDRVVWKGTVPRRRMIRALTEACCANAVFWRGHKRPERALWAAGQAIRVAPLDRQAWSEALRSLGRVVWPAGV